ncbi:MAG: right-handed parallel beta-helix repeat-containing protein [Kiritimatiellae bacterium]|nr:right-handed parallel beta-helix repeat-containing protein [Kiritimatiellia bacterium]
MTNHDRNAKAGLVLLAATAALAASLFAEPSPPPDGEFGSIGFSIAFGSGIVTHAVYCVDADAIKIDKLPAGRSEVVARFTQSRFSSVHVEGEAVFSLTADLDAKRLDIALTAVRATSRYPLAGFSFNQIAPFRALSAEEFARKEGVSPQRSAWSALDGRWIGVVSSSPNLSRFDYDVTEGGLRRGAVEFSFGSQGAQSTNLADLVHATYFWGYGGRPEWREKTDALPIFPSGPGGFKPQPPPRKVVREIDGSAHVDGGTRLGFSMFRPVSDPAVAARMDNPGKVLECDLRGLGVKWWREKGGKTAALEYGQTRRDLPIPVLAVDGEWMRLAEWPNGGKWAFIGEYGPLKDCPAGNPAHPVFRYDGSRPQRWLKAPEVLLHGFWTFNWFDSFVPAERIDAAHSAIELAAAPRIKFADLHPTGGRWRAVNLVEELDVPGEYALDRDSEMLYVMPPAGFSKSSRVSIASGTDPVVRRDGIRDVEFSGLLFENGCGSGVVLSNCVNVVFTNCTFRNFRLAALDLQDCRDCRVVDCTFENIGTYGARVDGGDRRTLEDGGNVVENCRFRKGGVVQPSRTFSLRLSGVGNVARGNVFCDGTGIAAVLAGNNLVFERNVVSNVCYAIDDTGAVYQGRNPSARGNVIRENLFVDISSGLGHGVAAIYFDDGDSGNLVVGNTFIRCGDPGRGGFGTVFSHGGYDNVVRGCRFVECDRPFGSAPWSDDRWREYVFSKDQTDNFCREVDVKSRPYALSYPELDTWFRPDDAERRVNWSIGCVLEEVPVRRATNVVHEYKPGVTEGAWEHKDLLFRSISKMRQMSVCDHLALAQAYLKKHGAERKKEGEAVGDGCECCALVDSIGIALAGKKATGHVSYAKEARLLVGELVRRQRKDGGFGSSLDCTARARTALKRYVDQWSVAVGE